MLHPADIDEMPVHQETGQRLVSYKFMSNIETYIQRAIWLYDMDN